MIYDYERIMNVLNHVHGFEWFRQVCIKAEELFSFLAVAANFRSSGDEDLLVGQADRTAQLQTGDLSRG